MLHQESGSYLWRDRSRVREPSTNAAMVEEENRPILTAVLETVTNLVSNPLLSCACAFFCFFSAAVEPCVRGQTIDLRYLQGTDHQRTTYHTLQLSQQVNDLFKKKKHAKNRLAEKYLLSVSRPIDYVVHSNGLRFVRAATYARGARGGRRKQAAAGG